MEKDLNKLAAVIRKQEDELLVLTTENSIRLKAIEKLDADTAIQQDVVRMSEESVQFIELVASGRRNDVKSKIEYLVTEALHNVYGEHYKLEFTYSIKNNRSSVDIEVIKNTTAGEVRRDIDGFGGGVSDTISLPLKLLVMLKQRNADKLLIADEPGKHINPERVELFADFVRQVCDRLGVQVIMCSHHESMVDYADVVYYMKHDGNTSTVERRK